ncbi:MAG: hypothetical protein Q7S34_01785 [bacterium]|nr:hypothetical protein [bacterium]
MADKPKPASFAPFFILLAVIVAMWVFGGGANINKSSNSVDSSVEIVQTNAQKQQLQKEADQAQRIGPISLLNSYFSLQTGNVWGNDPKNEYVEVSVSQDAPAHTLFTGFEIKSAFTGRGTTMGRGALVPNFGQGNIESSIFLSPGDRVYIVSGKSPLGYSFRVNKCVGYFSQSQQYNPSLSYNCPAPRDERLPNFGANNRNACLNYIESLGNCSLPKLNYETSISIGPECVDYVTNNIGYSSCVKNHKDDSDFYKPEWRIYLNQPETLWQSSREMIKLLDLNKKTAAYVEY